MPYNDAGRNALADGIAAVAGFASAHDDDPSTTGANELSGGSPAYARQAISYAASASGQGASDADITLDVPAGTTVRWIGYWSASTAGTFYGYGPAGGGPPFAGSFDADTDAFTAYAHGLSDDDTVCLADIQAAGLPTGFAEGTVYHVVSATTDTFQLSATEGGAAITSTADGAVILQTITPEVFAGQGEYLIPAGSLVHDARLV